MIDTGTLCIIVAEPKDCVPPSLSGRTCTVAPLRIGQSLMVKCNVVFPDDVTHLFAVFEWNALRPIAPPPSLDFTRRNKELEGQ